MSAAQWTLSLVLLTWALGRNLGTRTVTRLTYVVPIFISVTIGGYFLRSVPTEGNDLTLFASAGVIGVIFGLAASASTRLRRLNGKLLASTGFTFALLWIVMIAGRVAFATWANGSGARAVGRFSMEHAITGADAWTAAFVIMALAMMLSRTAAIAVRASLASRANWVLGSAVDMGARNA